uniref:Anillin homology domain-containing protein n=1 Tax=Monodon monoceros TaxID=40151 RepID=A0A8C6AX82_MONMO
MFSRNHRSRVTAASGSALEMEFKRSRCWLSLFCDPPEDTGPASCRWPAPSQSVLVCNSRTPGYTGELQRRQRPPDSGPPAERSPCRSQVCISDLRIPLMWKDTEDFKNEGDLHRRAVFLLLQIGECTQDTEMILVDRTLTAIPFHNKVLFAEAGPDSELRLELYGACVEEEGALAGAPKRLATELSSSLGCSSGRRVRASLETIRGSGSSPILLPTPASGGRYHLLAHTTLTLAAVQDGLHTHDLSLTSHEENPAWLPLEGSVCCHLVAQPFYMTQPTASGTRRAQQAGELQDWVQAHGVLRGTNSCCHRQPEDTDTGEEPLFTVVINKETQVGAGELDQAVGRPFTLSISNQYGEDEVTHTLQAESRGALQSWTEALWQLFFDVSQWKQCRDEIMKIETPAPRKPLQVLANQSSWYHEMVTAIEPLDDITAVTDSLAQLEGTRLETPPDCPAWPLLACFSGPNPSPDPFPALEETPNGLPGCCPRDHSPGASRSVAPLPLKWSPQSRGLCSKGPPHTWLQSPV